MMQPQTSYAEVLKLVNQLPTRDKVRLIGQVVSRIERELTQIPTPRKSLRGIWKELDITTDDIAKSRREMWANFPRGDV